MKYRVKNIVAAILLLSLNACSSFLDKDNTPVPASLIEFKPAFTAKPLWYTSPDSNTHLDSLKLTPAISGTIIFSVSRNGKVTATDLTTGKSLWQTNLNSHISSETTAYGGLVYVGTQEGKLFALKQNTGEIQWQATSSSEILAPVAAQGNTIVVKTIDGQVSALSATDGHALWRYQQSEPHLILRGASAPQISHGSVIVGFGNGELVKLNLQNGYLQWQKTIAQADGLFAIQRMIDIDAHPIIMGDRIYVATYQGRIASLSFNTGNELWSHEISSYSGMVMDNTRVYLSDAQSHIWAFNAANGTIDWHQTQLAARTITAPALLGNYLIVADAKGFLHWMDKQTGHFAARTFINSSGIAAAPLIHSNNVYVYTQDGHLAAYTIG